MRTIVAPSLLWLLLAAVACQHGSAPAVATGPTASAGPSSSGPSSSGPSSSGPSSSGPSSSGPSSSGPVEAPAPAVEPVPAAEKKAPCPDDMVFVDTSYCPNPELRCRKSERDDINHITICHRFAEEEQRCAGPLRQQRFCIDPFEYPNQRGGHPPVNVSAFDASAMCEEQGKRLCYESEWIAACEGPDKLPFPYGYARSKERCNIDNHYITPSLERAHSGNRQVQAAELARLDQSVPSGSMETCKSGFGVYDMTGNFDEWTLSERPRGKSKWSALKGGAWGHVRNACRPVTTSHVPQFSYYFISFRCCADPDPEALPTASADLPLWQPPAPTPRGPVKNRGWPAEG